MTGHRNGRAAGRAALGIASRWAFALALAITVAALVVSLLPRVPLPPGAFGDKWVHAAGYASLAMAWRAALRMPAAGVLAGVFAFGGLVEGLQWITPWRTFEWADMLANGTGAALGLLLFAAVGGLARRLRPA